MRNSLFRANALVSASVLLLLANIGLDSAAHMAGYPGRT